MAARDVFVNQLKHKIKKILATVTGLYWESHGFKPPLQLEAHS